MRKGSHIICLSEERGSMTCSAGILREICYCYVLFITLAALYFTADRLRMVEYFVFTRSALPTPRSFSADLASYHHLNRFEDFNHPRFWLFSWSYKARVQSLRHSTEAAKEKSLRP